MLPQPAINKTEFNPTNTLLTIHFNETLSFNPTLPSTLLVSITSPTTSHPAFFTSVFLLDTPSTTLTLLLTYRHPTSSLDPTLLTLAFLNTSHLSSALTTRPLSTSTFTIALHPQLGRLHDYYLLAATILSALSVTAYILMTVRWVFRDHGRWLRVIMALQVVALAIKHASYPDTPLTVFVRAWEPVLLIRD